GITDELLDRAAVPLENPPQRLEVARHDLPHRLGIQALAQLGPAHDIGEYHGDGLAGSPAERRPSGKRTTAGRAKPRGVRPEAATPPTYGHGRKSTRPLR